MTKGLCWYPKVKQHIKKTASFGKTQSIRLDGIKIVWSMFDSFLKRFYISSNSSRYSLSKNTYLIYNVYAGRFALQWTVELHYIYRNLNHFYMWTFEMKLRNFNFDIIHVIWLTINTICLSWLRISFRKFTEDLIDIYILI